MNAAQVAGLALLSELSAFDFEDAHATLVKILANIVSAPTEPKFRRLKTTNARIAKLLSARGARQLLIGSGFVEETDALAIPEGAAVGPVQAAVAGLTAQQETRKAEEVRGPACPCPTRPAPATLAADSNLGPLPRLLRRRRS